MNLYIQSEMQSQSEKIELSGLEWRFIQYNLLSNLS